MVQIPRNIVDEEYNIGGNWPDPGLHPHGTNSGWKHSEEGKIRPQTKSNPTAKPWVLNHLKTKNGRRFWKGERQPVKKLNSSESTAKKKNRDTKPVGAERKPNNTQT